MVKRHAPSPFILSIYPSWLPSFPIPLPCIPLPLLHPYTFFKEMRYNLQGRSCLAFSDKALMAARGLLHGYTSPRCTRAYEHLQSQFSPEQCLGAGGLFPRVEQRDTQMRHLAWELSQAHNITSNPVFLSCL